MSPTLAHLYLALAIANEMVGSTCLKLTAGFTRPLPIGFAYAVWAGLGIAVIVSGAVVLSAFSRMEGHA